MVYTDPEEVPWSAYLAVAAIFLTIVAAVLPWFGAGGQTTTGLAHDDGNFTIGVGLAALGLLVAFEWDVVAQLGTALAGVVTLWVGVENWQRIGDEAALDPKLGLYLTLLAGATLLGVAIYGLVRAYQLRDGPLGDDGAPGERR